MTEGTQQPFDNPFVYHVNDISDLDQEVVWAHKRGDQQVQKELLSAGKTDFNVFICLSKHGHAYVMCVPHVEGKTFPDVMSREVFRMPRPLLCWSFELCFEETSLQIYKLKKTFAIFRDLRMRVATAYFMATFKKTSAMAFQFAALQAAPCRYNAIAADCVEFSKQFCLSLLRYCDNKREIEESMRRRIKEASATGLNLERMSRHKHQDSGFLDSFSLGGTTLLLLCLLSLIVAVLVAVLVKHYS